MKKRPWNDVGAETRQMGGRAQAAGATVETFGLHFRSGNPGKSRKTLSGKTWKNGHPKHVNVCGKGAKMESKLMPQRIQNLCKHRWREIAGKSWKKAWFSDVLNHAKIHEISNFSRKGVFEKSMIIAGLFAENHDGPFKKDTESWYKSHQQSIKKHARKRHAQIMNKHQQWSPKGS